MKIIYLDLVKLSSHDDQVVVVKTNWPLTGSILTLTMDQVEGIEHISNKNSSLLLEVKEKGFFKKSFIYKLKIVPPLGLSSDKVDEILKKVQQEDPWKI